MPSRRAPRPGRCTASTRARDAAAARGGASTHGLGLAEAIELGRALGRLPARLVVYAIEGQGYATGAPLSPPVARAAEEVVGELRARFERR